MGKNAKSLVVYNYAQNSQKKKSINIHQTSESHSGKWNNSPNQITVSYTYFSAMYMIHLCEERLKCEYSSLKIF